MPALVYVQPGSYDRSKASTGEGIAYPSAESFAEDALVGLTCLLGSRGGDGDGNSATPTSGAHLFSPTREKIRGSFGAGADASCASATPDSNSNSTSSSPDGASSDSICGPGSRRNERPLLAPDVQLVLIGVSAGALLALELARNLHCIGTCGYMAPQVLHVSVWAGPPIGRFIVPGVPFANPQAECAAYAREETSPALQQLLDSVGLRQRNVARARDLILYRNFALYSRQAGLFECSAALGPRQGRMAAPAAAAAKSQQGFNFGLSYFAAGNDWPGFDGR